MRRVVDRERSDRHGLAKSSAWDVMFRNFNSMEKLLHKNITRHAGESTIGREQQKVNNDALT